MNKLKIYLSQHKSNVIGYDNEALYIEHEWKDENVKIKWSELSLSIWDLIELFRAIQKEDFEFARDKVYPQLTNSIKGEGFNHDQASLIESEAYDRGHFAGYEEVLIHVANYITFAKELIKRGNN
jgi:hypothetical protein